MKKVLLIIMLSALGANEAFSMEKSSFPPFNLYMYMGQLARLKDMPINSEKITRYLEDADVNYQVKPGEPTILDFALLRDDPKLVKLILEHGADANKIGARNRSPLINYLDRTYLSRPWTRSLIHPSEDFYINFESRPNIEIVRLLMGYGADVNATGPVPQFIFRKDTTPLIEAALAGEPEILKLLLDGIRGISPLLQESGQKQTYLSLLPKDLIKETAQYINRADPNFKDKDGNTALSWAIQVLEMILKHADSYNNVDQLIKRYEEVINILEPITKKR